jgi:hypothetical protein
LLELISGWSVDLKYPCRYLGWFRMVINPTQLITIYLVLVWDVQQVDGDDQGEAGGPEVLLYILVVVRMSKMHRNKLTSFKSQIACMHGSGHKLRSLWSGTCTVS